MGKKLDKAVDIWETLTSVQIDRTGHSAARVVAAQKRAARTQPLPLSRQKTRSETIRAIRRPLPSPTFSPLRSSSTQTALVW